MQIELDVAKKRCPLCQTNSAADATVCAFCGCPLVSLLPAPLITEPVPEGLTSAAPAQSLFDPAALDPDIVAFIVAGQQAPIMVKGSRSIVLGRYSPGETAPTVDLTPFQAGVLGVSRQHARLTRERGGLFVEDLSSTNGTRLNKVRLQPYTPAALRSGDMLQLGQLTLCVYFNADGSSAEETITLKSSGGEDLRLTPHLLATRIIPYLNALAGIQAVCDAALARRPTDVDISLISSDAQNALISVRIERASEAVRLARGPMAAWRRANAENIARLLFLSSSARATVPLDGAAAARARTQAVSEVEVAEARALARALHESAQEVALAYLADLVPSRAPADLKDDADKLMSHLNVLAFSSLYIVSEL